LDWCAFSRVPDAPLHEFGDKAISGTSLLTFGAPSIGGSLAITDQSHNHLALGILAVAGAHLTLSTFSGFGHSLGDILSAHGTARVTALNINSSVHKSLCLSLAGVGTLTSLVSQQCYALNPFCYLSFDLVSYSSLWVHHQYISCLLMVGSYSHAGIFLVRDYSAFASHATSNQDQHNHPNLSVFGGVAKVLLNGSVIVSTLSSISIFLGAHTLGIFVHNDVVCAFGEVEKQILLEPVFAELIQQSSGKVQYAFGTLVPAQTVSTASVAESYLPLGPSDFLAHHSFALGLHCSVLIQWKGALDARGSSLFPDKLLFGYGFPCDGPGRGGTCDISTWDSIFLAIFWVLNTAAWSTFYFHWRFLSLGQHLLSPEDENASELMGWFRDYLWNNSSPLILGYSAKGTDDMAVWDFAFLLAHLDWAVGFMFLISWRGYWQELIDSISCLHMLTPFMTHWHGSILTPFSLSISQARLVGCFHFTTGYILTFAAFVFSSTS
jgi:photosystem I P700 chlorophyll a apoprotein A2